MITEREQKLNEWITVLTGSSLLQACQLKRDTITYEEKEQQLVSDCVKELRECNARTHICTEKAHFNVHGCPFLTSVGVSCVS